MAKGLKTNISVEVAIELAGYGYVKDVWVDRYGERGGILYYYLEHDETFYSVYRLYSEAKEDYMKFPSRVRIPAKRGRLIEQQKEDLIEGKKIFQERLNKQREEKNKNKK